MQIISEPGKTPPCQDACPAHIDVPRYLRHVSQGDFDRALSVIYEKLPFPRVCGHICSRPCEGRCNMRFLDGPIAIRSLKRAATERGKPIALESTNKATGKKAAVIGAGPAGLTAAYYLCLKGHEVTVFEANEKPGGMMGQKSRGEDLPEEVLEGDIHVIMGMGFDLQARTRIETIDEPFRRKYNAILIAVGVPSGAEGGSMGESPENLRRLGLHPTEKGTIPVNQDTLETEIKGVFACGEIVTGARPVIYNIASGKKAAASIDRYLGGNGDLTQELTHPEGEVVHFVPGLTMTRVDPYKRPVSDRTVHGGEEGTASLEETAKTEASRCLRCDLPIIADTDKCSGCITCELVCSFKGDIFNPLNAAIKIDRIRGGAEYEISFSEDCDKCGLCVRYCPREVLIRERKEDEVHAV